MGGGGKKTSRSTQSVEYPDWINNAGQLLVSKGEDLVNRPFESYTGNRVAGFSGDQTNAFQQVRDLIGNAPQIGPEVQDNLRQFASAPAQNVSTERVVDTNGRLGSFGD